MTTHTYDSCSEEDEQLDEMDKRDVCEDCGNYKTNRKEKWCNSCKYVNG